LLQGRTTNQRERKARISRSSRKRDTSTDVSFRPERATIDDGRPKTVYQVVPGYNRLARSKVASAT
jgi:hypothetical protein